MALDLLPDQAEQPLLDQTGGVQTSQSPGSVRPAPAVGTPYPLSFLSFNAEELDTRS